jgi:hypothetical protein
VPAEQELARVDREQRRVGGHHVGGGDARHQETHQRALHAHRRETEQRADQRERRVRLVRERNRQAEPEERGEQHRLQAKRDRERRHPATAQQRGEDRGEHAGPEEHRDRQHLDDEPLVMGDELGAHHHEAARHLRDVEAEQRKERAGIHIAGREAEQRRHDAGNGRSFGHAAPPWRKESASAPPCHARLPWRPPAGPLKLARHSSGR